MEPGIKGFSSVGWKFLKYKRFDFKVLSSGHA